MCLRRSTIGAYAPLPARKKEVVPAARSRLVDTALAGLAGHPPAARPKEAGGGKTEENCVGGNPAPRQSFEHPGQAICGGAGNFLGRTLARGCCARPVRWTFLVRLPHLTEVGKIVSIRLPAPAGSCGQKKRPRRCGTAGPLGSWITNAVKPCRNTSRHWLRGRHTHR
jgi:hypothetical protein